LRKKKALSPLLNRTEPEKIVEEGKKSRKKVGRREEEHHSKSLSPREKEKERWARRG